jgi:CBS domain containing-hemolysin-like protein
MINDIILLALLLILSAFFSSSEIAFVVANKIKIDLRARKKNIYAKNAQYFVQNPDNFFSTILLSNNVVNIAFASLISVFLIQHYQLSEFEILIFSTILLLVFGELIPKYLGRELADDLILISSMPLRILTFVLFPIVKIISKISGVINRSTEREEVEMLHIYDKEDIQILIDESSEAGKMDEEQSDIISKVMEIRDQRVYEAITPRTDIAGIDISSSIEEVIDKFIESGYSKLIVYDENLDNIKGMVLLKDLFNNPPDLKSVIREVVFIPDTKKSLDMLNEFLNKQFTIAVVVDEFGGTAGIITVEDLIEELFGEIRDEYDIEENVVRKIDSNSFLLSGKVEIDYLNEEYNFNIEEGDYETIAGYITFKLGRIPVRGETFRVENFNVHVLKSDKTKIDLIKLTILTELAD